METRKEQVLQYLKTHKHMTVNDGIRALHTTELRHYIAQLRKDGHIIGDEWVTDKKTGQQFKRYKLTKEAAR